MGLNANIFKEYDIRGIADIDFEEKNLNRISYALGMFFSKRGVSDIVVSGDVRPSTERIKNQLVSRLMNCGFTVYDCGYIPTPLNYFAVKILGKSAGIMVTASHNPSEYNGFKITYGDSTVYGKDIQEIYDYARQNEYGMSEARGELITIDNILEQYVEYVCERIKPARKLKVVLDAGNGVAGPAASTLFKALGCETVELFCNPDPNFPNHHPDPTIPENLVSLQKKVLDTGADLGLAFDGDGDRLGVIDEKGNIIWGDKLQILFWRELLPKYPAAEVLVEVKCSQALFDEAKKLGGKPFFYKTGHSLIKAKMRERNLLFAGEMSGHMFFADEYFGYDDALYAGARLIRLLASKDGKLSELFKDVPDYF
ncbi:MAG: phosphomannomutase/phosphoglucomutase, partial [Clostridiales bacterium]|nr:phosphomannomutase/phosphoglucomutase [Clostridiales bacterium]